MFTTARPPPYRARIAPVSRMEVGGLMVVEVHLDHDPVEPRKFRHR